MNDLRSQLAPGWSGVNIGIMVLLFIAIPPLGLLMLGYIIWGRQLDLDLGQPKTFADAGSRLGRAFGAAKQSWSANSPVSTGRPDGPHSTPDSKQNEATHLQARQELDAERAKLEQDKSEFEAEKRAFDQSREVQS